VRALAAAAALAGLLLAGCGGGGDDARSEKKPPPEAARAVSSAERPGRDKLAIGITEQNANFMFAPGAREVPEPFARWRDELGKMHPAFVRLIAYWPALQPEEGQPANLSARNEGCLRTIPPCAGFDGLRDQIKALASRQKEGGWEGFVMIAGSPEWAAQDPAQCERPGTGPSNRPPSKAALPAYKRLIADILAIAKEEGADLRYWAPWNEPNHPFSISPQRIRCEHGARPVSVAPYVRLARAMKEALDEAPGEQVYTLAELAGLDRDKPTTTTIREFIGRLPRDLVCGTPVWTQHGYVGGREVLDGTIESLAAKHCEHEHAIWITETGVGAPRSGTERSDDPRQQRRACVQLHEQLAEWYADPRVTAAFQYTLREDDIFPTGLVSTGLDRAYPPLREWQQWGLKQRPRPEAPAPAAPACG
jgi:hypothetical protein